MRAGDGEMFSGLAASTRKQDDVFTGSGSGAPGAAVLRIRYARQPTRALQWRAALRLSRAWPRRRAEGRRVAGTWKNLY
jgi:hypothetical protein